MKSKLKFHERCRNISIYDGIGMVSRICGASLKDRIPATDLQLRFGLSSINDMLHWNVWMMMHGLKRLPCIKLMADNQDANHVRGFVT